MRNKSVQISLCDAYKTATASIKEDKPKLFRLLNGHMDWACPGQVL